MTNMIQRFRASWSLMREIEQYGRKSAALPVRSTWQKATWRDLGFNRARDEAYNVNAAVSSCVRALTFAFPEPRPLVLDKNDERLLNDPLQSLLDRPNPIMSHSELLTFVITYMAVGGNCYLLKVRNSLDGVIELWPYHDGHMTPIPGGTTGIAGYKYNVGDGEGIEIPARDIVHLKWPMPDLSQPWIALSPLRQVAKEVDTDGELTRMLYEVLINNVPIRTVINVPPGTSMSEQDADMFVARFMQRHRQGQPAVTEGVASISHLSLNLAELDLTSLRGVPESRICAAFGVPPEVAMLSVGQAHSTENNLYAADVRFTTRTLTPLWSLVAGELTQDLAPEFSDDVRVAYDVASIQALKKDEVATWTRVITGYDATLITKNEARAEMGLVPIGQLKITDEGDAFKGAGMTPDTAGDAQSDVKAATPILGYHIEAGVVSRNEARQQLGLQAEDTAQSDKIRELKEDLGVIQMAVNVGIPLDIALNLIGLSVTLPEPIDVTPRPPQLTDDQKRYPYPMAFKAKKATRTEAIREQMQTEVEAYISAQFEAAAGG